jgi:hypothetical protein
MSVVCRRSEWMAGAANEIAQHRYVRAIGTDASGIDRETEALGEVQIHAGIVEFRQTEARRGLDAVQAGRIDRTWRPVALPGTAREFIELFPIAFVPSVHRFVSSSFRCGAKPQSFSACRAALL